VHLRGGGDVQGEALAAADLTAGSQRFPFGLAQIAVATQVVGEFAGHLQHHGLRFAGLSGCAAGLEIGDGGADGDPADLVLAGECGDAGAVAERGADVVEDAEFGDLGAASGAAAGGPGGDEAFAGEFVLQVALELSDRDQDVDQHGGGRVGGGQVDDARQRPGQHPQLHAVRAAPFADGEDVGQVAAQPVQLRHGQPVTGPGVAGQLGEPGAVQGGDLRRRRRVGEQPHPVRAVDQACLTEQVGLPLGALLVGGHPCVDQLRHDRKLPFLPLCRVDPGSICRQTLSSILIGSHWIGGPVSA
jgi:hypothetical protein